MPAADVLYLADQHHAPYGERSLEEVADLSVRCTTHLLDQGASTVVVACNTASAAALALLRQRFPGTPFVGMEPALKPAAKATRNGVVAVLATTATFQGELFASLYERFGGDVRVHNQPCPGWAQLVEAGLVTGPEVENAVREHLLPVLATGADTIVLGCTHYPFLADVIARQAGGGVTIIDPSSAVAAQVERVVADTGSGGSTTLHTTGDAVACRQLVKVLTGLDLPATTVTLP